MQENSDLGKFISKSYAHSKSDEKCQENGHFDVWFFLNSKKIQKILQKKSHLSSLEDASSQPFLSLGKKNWVICTCAKVVHFEHMWRVDRLLFLENLFVGLCNFSRSPCISILSFNFGFLGRK